MGASERNLTPTIEINALDRPGLRRAPYCGEVELLQASGITPNVYLFAGPECWERADDRRIKHGAGSALVLPDDVRPSALRWPSVDALVVCWPPADASVYRRKIELAQALIRDGVRYAAIEHEPEWLNVWRKGEAAA